MARKFYFMNFDLEFISRFFYEMRIRVPKPDRDYLESLRRTKSMSNYLLALYMQKGERIKEDYIKAARYTMLPQLQDLAEKVANEILDEEILEKQYNNRDKEKKSGGSQNVSETLKKLGFDVNKLLAVHKGNIWSSMIYLPNNETLSSEELETFVKCSNGGFAEAGKDRLLLWSKKEDSLDMIEWIEKIVDAAKQYSKFMEKRIRFKEQLLRPYQIGDDYELVDYDETIENLRDQNRKIEHLRLEDIIVKDLDKKRYCFVYLLDISGSMKGLIHIGKGLLASLLQIFEKEEYAIGVFRDDFFVMKEVHEQKDMSDLTKDIVSLGSKGGTMLISGLDWAKDQFNRIGKDYEKVCFILGDFRFYWPETTYEKIKELIQSGIKIIGFSIGETESWGRATGNKVIDVSSILNQSRDEEDFVSRTLDEVYGTIFLQRK